MELTWIIILVFAVIGLIIRGISLVNKLILKRKIDSLGKKAHWVGKE